MTDLKTTHKHKQLGNLHINLVIEHAGSYWGRYNQVLDEIRFKHDRMRYTVSFWRNPKTNQYEINYAICNRTTVHQREYQLEPLLALTKLVQSPKFDKLIANRIRREIRLLSEKLDALAGEKV